MISHLLHAAPDEQSEEKGEVESKLYALFLKSGTAV